MRTSAFNSRSTDAVAPYILRVPPTCGCPWTDSRRTDYRVWILRRPTGSAAVRNSAAVAPAVTRTGLSSRKLVRQAYTASRSAAPAALRSTCLSDRRCARENLRVHSPRTVTNEILFVLRAHGAASTFFEARKRLPDCSTTNALTTSTTAWFSSSIRSCYTCGFEM